MEENELTAEQKKLMATYREVFSKMVRLTVVKPVKVKKVKKKSEEDELIPYP